MSLENALRADEISEQEAGIQDLEEALDDPETPFERISRLIGRQMLLINQKMLRVSPWENARVKTRLLTRQNQAWRMLHRQMMDAYRFRKNQQMDIASPQFKAAFFFLVTLFRDSMLQAGLAPDFAHNILMQYRDLVIKREPELKKVIAAASIN